MSYYSNLLVSYMQGIDETFLTSSCISNFCSKKGNNNVNFPTNLMLTSSFKLLILSSSSFEIDYLLRMKFYNYSGSFILYLVVLELQIKIKSCYFDIFFAHLFIILKFFFRISIIFTISKILFFHKF